MDIKKIGFVSFSIFLIILILVSQEFLPIGIYLIPFSLSGVVSAIKVLQYFDGKNSFKDVFFYLWVIMFSTTFVSPIIHFSRDSWVKYTQISPNNWMDWASIISYMFFYGIIVFLILERFSHSKIRLKNNLSFSKNAANIVMALMLISFIFQSYIYAISGGIIGYIRIYTERSAGDIAFSGMGLIFILTELFPILFILWFFIKNKNKNVKIQKVVIFLLLLFIAALFFGGLRGSRSNTVFTLIQGIILIHFAIFKFKRRHFLVFTFLFFMFMTVGRLYKSYGLDYVQNYNNYELEIYEDMSSVEKIIIGDLSRYGIMSYELFMLNRSNNYSFSYGSTYLYSFFTFAPFGKQIRTHLDLKGRAEASTELQYNGTSYQAYDKTKNSRVYGFVGESILNFGQFSFIFSFIFLFFILFKVRTWVNSISIEDARFILVPIILILVPVIINGDSNNVFFAIVKRVVPMLIILKLITVKVVNSK